MVKDGTIKIGDNITYYDIRDTYRWQIKSIRKGKCFIDEAHAEDNVVLGCSMNMFRGIFGISCLEQQIVVGDNYDKPFITDKFLVSVEYIPASRLKEARVLFKTDKLEAIGVVVNATKKNGKCYAQIEVLHPTYAKLGAKCVLIGEVLEIQCIS